MDRRRPWLMLPPHARAPEDAAPPAENEQKLSPDVHAIVSALVRVQVRLAHRQQQELNMKISELATKVDELISVANEVKSSASSQSVATAGAPVQEDDPLVQQLADRIDEAVRVLRGTNSPAPTPAPAPAPAVDPNAPVTDPGPNPFSPPPGQ